MFQFRLLKCFPQQRKFAKSAQYIRAGTAVEYRLSHKLPMNPKKVADKLKVSKSCQKVAEKLLNFPKSWRKVAKIFLLFVPFSGVKD